MSDNVFDQAPETTQAPLSPDNGNPPETGGPFLKVQDRVFNSPDDVVNKIRHADEHIRKLEEERRQDRERLAKLQADLEARKSIEDALADLRRGSFSSSTPDDSSDSRGETSQTATRDPKEDVSKLVEEILANKTAAEREAANEASMNRLVLEAYGDKSRETLAKIAQELGMTPADARNMARRQPSVFTRLFLPEQGEKVNTQAVQSRGVNTNNLSPVNTQAVQNTNTARPGGYTDMYTQYKESLKGRNPIAASRILAEITRKVQENPDFRNT